MRIALILALVLSAAGCAKKQKPAATPATTETKATEGSGGDAPGAGAPESTGDQDKMTGDPCDGGENKGK